MAKQEKIYDIAIIGGGPAGIMAANRAAELGAKVIIIEKNKDFGMKFLLTGGGRCNITHAEFDNRKLAESYGIEGKFLLSPLSIFNAKDTVNFFETHGIKTIIERGQRVFPESGKAAPLLAVLIKNLRKSGVDFMTGTHVVDFKQDGNNKITHILTRDKNNIYAKNFILCTGGKSYPKTGSIGEGYRWAQKLGHTITHPNPALVPIKIREPWLKKVQGISLKNVELSILPGDRSKKIKNGDKRFGEAMFAHFGLSGPIAIDLSKRIGERLSDGNAVRLALDLKPALTADQLDKRIQRDFKKFNNKLFRNSLADLLPAKLENTIVALSKINPNKKVHSVTKEERQTLVKILKGLEMNVNGLMGFDMAIVTTGGVSLKEINSKTMKSKIIDNLYFAGEIIDLDGPCGGYNLQICWTTGYVAGQSATENL